MAIDTSGFQKFSYIKDNGINKYLVEEYLLPGLAVQSRLGKGSRGIPLPTPFGKPQEFIPLADAATLVLSWLEDNNHLYAKDKGQLIKLMHKVSYEQFATIASEIYQDRVQDPNKLFTTARQQNLTLYREAQKKQTTTPTPKFDPGKAIDDYNQLYTQLLRATNLGTSPTLFQKILPAGVPVGRGDLSKQVLAQIIMQNITELRGAAHAYVGDEDKATQAVSRKLGQIIATSYPEQSAYLNLLGDKEISTNLTKFTENVEQQLIHDGIKLEEIDDLKNRAIAASGDVVATEYEIYQQVQRVLPLASDSEKKQFAKSLIQSINASAGRPLTSDEIINLAGTRIGADSTQLQTIKAELEKSGLTFAIEYRQNELSVIVDSHRLTRAEHNLLRRGINPFKTEKSEADLTIEKDKLLKEFQIDSGTKFATIEEAHQFEQGRDKPNINWTRRFREHQDQLGAYSLLDFNEKGLVNRSRIGRRLENWRSNIDELQTKFFDNWVEFDENLPWNKGIRAASEWYDKLAEGFVIKVGKTQIPLFRIVPWIYDRIDEWKKVTTLKAIAKTSTWKNPVGKFIHWNLNQYKLGDYTVNGALYSTFRSAWGSSTKWALEKSVALATKMGVGSAFKYATVSASRTGTRLLLQIGGRTLARLGAKIGTEAIGALLAAGTAIGTAFSVVLGALMVFDLIKLGWNFVKNFLSSSDFRSSVAKIGLTVGAIFLAIPAAFASVLSVAGLLMLSVLQPILLSLVIIGIMIFVNNHNLSDLMTTTRLDPGPGLLQQIAVNILCEDDSAGVEVGTPVKSTKSSVASCANCLAKYLTACYGGGKLTGDLVTSKFGCLLATAVAPAAAEAIKDSATGYNWLQCVGFARAAAICGGGDLPGQAVASGYIRNPTPGYKFTQGAEWCQPGDFGIVDGAIGHIFVVGSNNNGTLTGIDANFVGDGVVSNNTPFPTSMVAGCLKKI